MGQEYYGNIPGTREAEALRRGQTTEERAYREARPDEERRRRVAELMRVTRKPGDAIGFVYGKRRGDIELPTDRTAMLRDELERMMAKR